ncbi:MAG: LysM peptidoglycan-binding domain-containing protein [Clostridiaceae bacterium]|mgnify:CR=1 FL=1|jgi:hypothetical protein|nr:LysM peptidoglycan-binding domain-containing protein [Clostridiaceae bacterium]
MELIKKPVRTYRTIETRETEELFENSIIVPDSKPDVKTLLVVNAECFVSKVEKSGRMLEVGGEIKYRILYLADTPDNRLESITSRFPWSVTCQRPKTDGEIGVAACCRCQHTEASAVNGRKIVARSVTSLICRFYEIANSELGREIEGGNVFVKSIPINVVSLRDNLDTVARVGQTLALPHGSPAIGEILFARVNLGSPQVRYGEDGASLECKGTLNMLYRGDMAGDSVESVVLEFPVNVNTGIDPGGENIVLASAALKNWEVEPQEDSDGIYTQVSVSMEVEVNAQAVRHEEQQILEDAYCVDSIINLNRAPLDIVTDERELVESHEANAHIRLDSDNGSLDEIYMVSAGKKSILSNISGDMINVQGSVGVDVVYLAERKTHDTRSQAVEIPFNRTLPLPDGENWQIAEADCFIEDSGFEIISNDSLDVTVKISIRLRLCKCACFDCIESVEEVRHEAPARKAPILLYFAQPGDTLWSIAKHYRIPPENLARDNNMDPNDAPEVGKKMFIMA